MNRGHWWELIDPTEWLPFKGTRGNQCESSFPIYHDMDFLQEKGHFTNLPSSSGISTTSEAKVSQIWCSPRNNFFWKWFMSQLVVNSQWRSLEHNLKAFQMTSKDFKNIMHSHSSAFLFCFCFYLSSKWEFVFKISTKKMLTLFY